MSLYRSAPLFSLRDVFGESVLWTEHVEMRDHVGTLPQQDRSYTTWYMRWHCPKGDLFDLPYSARLCYGDRELCIVSGLHLAAVWNEWKLEELPKKGVPYVHIDRYRPGDDTVKIEYGKHRELLPLAFRDVAYLGYTHPRNVLEPLWTPQWGWRA